jgi:hypothetical protein
VHTHTLMYTHTHVLNLCTTIGYCPWIFHELMDRIVKESCGVLDGVYGDDDVSVSCELSASATPMSIGARARPFRFSGDFSQRFIGC